MFDFFTMNKKEALIAVESILEDVDAVIGSFIEAGEDANARALCEEFKEWFLDYDQGKEVQIMTLKMIKRNKKINKRNN